MNIEQRHIGINDSRKIALFLGTLQGGGAQRVMINLSRGFSEQGVDVDLVLSNARGPYLKDVPSGVRLIDLKARRVIFSIPRLIKYLEQEQPEVMISTVGHVNVTALIARYLSRSRTRLFVRVENTISRVIAEETSIRSFMLRFLIRHLYSAASGIIAPSTGVAEDLAKCMNLAPDLIQVVYNPVLRPEILQKAKATVYHRWLSESEVPVVIAVGRLTRQKDFATLIRAFSYVRRAIKSKLIILGEGEERSNLEALINDLRINDDVDLPGFVENPYAYMARSQVYVLSSRWEGLPNTLIEAMAVGTPVVSTNCKSGPDEILDNGNYGWLVPCGDYEAIANAILNVLTTDDNPMPDEKALGKYHIDECVNRYLDVLLNRTGGLNN